MSQLSKNANNIYGFSVWTFLVPVLVWGVFIIGEIVHWVPFYILSFLALIVGVLNAVHHAEVVAKKVGEPYGALILALAVTLIEVSIIVSLMFEAGADSSMLARDTVFATVMIILTGMVGLVILIGGIKFKNQTFSIDGAKAAITVLVAISVLTLILPNFTLAVTGPFYSTEQLAFVAFVTLILYGSFLFVQTIRHKDDFISDDEAIESEDLFPSKKETITSALLLVIFLVVIVLLAESMAHPLESFIEEIGAPREIVGILIASIILLPEGISAVNAARKNQLQQGLNLSLGSSLATIGLTLPTVSFISIATGIPISLGLSSEMMVLFLLSLFIIVLSLSTGKTTILQGIVLLVIFSVYLLVNFVP
ncbi:MAG: ionic transporter y4hA [Chryseotalea sp. WA131a]|nr:MAG: ionic transporter y4hA [Chryseotalea sp. WA131a]